MSYNVGQFKRTALAISNYVTAEGELDEQGNKLGNLTINNNLIEHNFKANTLYGIRGTVKRTSGTNSMNFRIKLIDSQNKNKYQIIDSYKYNTVVGTFIDIIFMPKYNFDQIILEDMDNKNEIFTLNKTSFYKITNLIGYSKSKIPSSVKQIGIQGPPGLTFVINGEKIRMGKSGIYMSNEMEIDSVGFYLETKQSAQLGEIDPDNPVGEGNPLMYPDSYTFFIMDYKY